MNVQKIKDGTNYSLIQLNLKYVDNLKFYYQIELQIYYTPVIKLPTSLRYLYWKRGKKR